ncbi:MAG: SPOR domain-containing protein [Bacteroidales bacterium]|nr:SPOR domain-containing protein [Bacteroidales bacterium]
MKIASSIADLLFEHECVVIPGLGGFITKNHPAEIHSIKHQFKPPHKEIVFNQHLRANDGMLLNYIAQKEALAYADAKKKMDRFVLRCLDEMEHGRRITFRNIGSIYYDNHKQVVFDADTTQNYLADSFGLTGFVSPMILREDFKQKLEQTMRQQREEKQRKLHTDPVAKGKLPKSNTKAEPVFKASRRPNRYKKQLFFIAFLLLFMLAGWSYMNINTVSRYYEAYSGWVPFFYASPNEFFAKHADKIVLDRYIPDEKNEIAANLQQSLRTSEATLIPDISSQEADIIEEKNYAEEQDFNDVNSFEANTEKANTAADGYEVEAVVVEPLPVEEETVTAIGETIPFTTHQAGFFIIAGAFRDKDNADKLIGQLRGKGFEAIYAGQTNTGLWRIAFEAHQERSAAIRRLAVIQNEENPGAWIFSF